MPCLLDLPNELICQIIEELNNDDIETFTESCKFIGILAADTRGELTANDKWYTCITIWDRTYKANNVFTPLDCLGWIFHNPRLALYPRSLTIGLFWEKFWVHYDSIWGNEDDDVEDDLKDSIRKALRNCPYVYPEEVQEWAYDIRCGHLDAGPSLLLALLPNLESICLYDA